MKLTTNLEDDEIKRIAAQFEDALVPVKGDRFAFTYRYEPDLYMPKLWCRLHWITDIQLKKLCDEALLEKEEARHSFKYGGYWWTVTHDRMRRAKVLRDTDYYRKMWMEPINDHRPTTPIPAILINKES